MDYKVLPTKIGLAIFTNSLITGKDVVFKYMAVGDGGGVPVEPNSSQTGLVRETTRHQINSLTKDPLNAGQFIAEAIIPEDVGDFYVREAGIFDDEGNLLFVANYPESKKPVMASGSGTVMRIRLVVQMSENANIVLKIDPSVVLSTREFVEQVIDKHVKAIDPHPQYVLKKDLEKLSFMVGIPFAYPLSKAPVGWISLSGQAINPITSPKLAALYGANLPDLRGEFIRGWDDGRGVDVGRGLLDFQAASSVLGTPVDTGLGTVSIAPLNVKLLSTTQGLSPVGSVSRNGVGRYEVYPRNIAFNYITPLG